MSRTGLLVCAALLAPSFTPAAGPEGKKVALVVGVKEYDSAHFAPLRFTENDAEKLTEVLKGQGFEVRLLTTTRGGDDAPTAKNIRAALAALVDGRTRRDLVLLALSGHGVQMQVADPDEKLPDRTYGYFCPTDASLSATVSFGTGRCERLISLNDTLAALGRCDAGSKLVMVDACRNEMKATATARAAEPGAIVVPPGVGALFSCKSGEKSFEIEKLGHGLFFHYVLDGLKGEAKNKYGEVTWTRLIAHVKEEVTRNAGELVGSGGRQVPFSSGSEIAEVVLMKSSFTPDKPEAARPGAGEADFRQAMKHYLGVGAAYDLPEAAKLMRKAADARHAVAQAALALFLDGGIGLDQDGDLAKEYAERCLAGLRRAAGRGEPDAEWLMGEFARNGLAVEMDEAEAVKWFKKAVDHGHLDAADSLAGMYLRGEGVEKDEKEAVRLYRWSSDKGYVSAIGSLADLHREGIGVEKDEKTALILYRRAGKKGSTSSMMWAGAMLRDGTGVEKDLDEARTWFLEAAKLGDSEGMVALGWLYREGLGVEMDGPKAVDWYEKAAEKGNGDGMASLGAMYRDGTGVEKDEKKAFLWYKKAAAKGNHDGQTGLGALYRDGIGVEKDEVEAVKLFRKAADGGDTNGMVRLGEMYRDGAGVDKDEKEAAKWFEKAADAGSEEGKELLEKLKKGTSR